MENTVSEKTKKPELLAMKNTVCEKTKKTELLAMENTVSEKTKKPELLAMENTVCEKTKKIELLAPSGSMESLEAALRFGADAVYLGGRILQLRAPGAGFSQDDLKKAVATVHAAGKKVYVTVNCFVKTSELKDLGDYAKELYESGVDAAIVSDIGAVDTVKKAAPELDVHISTQANCCNSAAAKVYYNMGASRIVLAREMTLDDIREMSANIPKNLELEAFVHGAMCMSYSGRCMISSFLNGRSGNRGDCTQPCRWNYHLTEHTRPGVFIPVEENENGTAILSSHDLKCIGFLEEIAAAGVSSFKIEGRMKTAFYVSTVVNAYRRAMDKTADIELLEKELEGVSHRPYAEGFYFGEMKKGHNNEGAYIQGFKFAALVREKTINGVTAVEVRNKICTGDTLEVLSPEIIGESFVVDEIISSKGETKQVANLPGEIIKIKTPFTLDKGDIMRISVAD